MEIKDKFKQYIEENYNTTFLENAALIDKDAKKDFKRDMLEGIDKLFELKDKYKNKPALIMGLGPSLLEIDKKKYDKHVKLTCNHFHRVPDFFDDSFKPDFWCAANSYAELRVPFEICLERDIDIFLTIPIRLEFNAMLRHARAAGKMHLVNPWMWEQQVFQHLIAYKFNFAQIYTRCNTITNHMIAFAFWLGCNPISIAGFDLSYRNALEEKGTTHAGFNDDWIEEDNSVLGNNAFDQIQERGQILADLYYMACLAEVSDTKLINLSHEYNGLPKEITNKLTPTQMTELSKLRKKIKKRITIEAD